MKLQSVELTHVGNVRSENQDSIFSVPENGVFMVADGMGGEKAGAEASAQVVTTVRQVATEFFKLRSPGSPSAVESMLRDALQQANRDVFAISIKEPDKTGLGSTGSLLTLHKGVYFIAQVGDSRIYMLREGKPRLMTRDHTVVWALYENGVITRDQLETHPERHLLTQCVGGPKPLNVDTYEGRLQEGDVFLICSDGLTGYAGEETVLRLFTEGSEDLQKCASDLIQAALDGGGGDNVSVVMARVEKLEPEDDWTPEVTPTPRKLDVAGISEMGARVGSNETPRRKSPALLLVMLLVLGLAGAALYLMMYPKSISVPMEIVAPADASQSPIVDLEKLVVTVEDEGGKSVPEPVTEREGTLLKLTLPKNGSYKLRVKAPGLVPQEEKRYLSGNDTEPFKVELRLAGRVDIAVTDPSQIESLELKPTGTGSDAQSAAWAAYTFDSNKSSDKLRLVHDIEPNVGYQLVVRYKSGGTPFDQPVIVDAGKKTEYSIKPQ